MRHFPGKDLKVYPDNLATFQVNETTFALKPDSTLLFKDANETAGVILPEQYETAFLLIDGNNPLDGFPKSTALTTKWLSAPENQELKKNIQTVLTIAARYGCPNGDLIERYLRGASKENGIHSLKKDNLSKLLAQESRETNISGDVIRIKIDAPKVTSMELMDIYEKRQDLLLLAGYIGGELEGGSVVEKFYRDEAVKTTTEEEYSYYERLINVLPGVKVVPTVPKDGQQGLVVYANDVDFTLEPFNAGVHLTGNIYLGVSGHANLADQRLSYYKEFEEALALPAPISKNPATEQIKAEKRMLEAQMKRDRRNKHTIEMPLF